MNQTYKVSVVLSVYDQAAQVARTIDNVLQQQGVELQLVIVDDGADDDVQQVLSSYSSEPRIRLIHQQNRGLTQALVRGCAAALHPLIARIDVGDQMLPNRLRLQAGLLDANPHIGFVSSWVDIVTEEGYLLYSIRQPAQQLHDSLLGDDASKLITPFHSSVMFRQQIYQRVGGYRPEFYFAQDCDLWSRMIEVADIEVIAQTLTIGLFSPSGISGRYAASQRALKKLAATANGLRKRGQSERDVLAEAQRLRPSKNYSGTGVTGVNQAALSNGVSQPAVDSEFATLYFLARCLSDNRSPHANEYWRRVIVAKPWSVLSWAYLLQSWFFRGTE